MSGNRDFHGVGCVISVTATDLIKVWAGGAFTVTSDKMFSTFSKHWKRGFDGQSVGFNQICKSDSEFRRYFHLFKQNSHQTTHFKAFCYILVIWSCCFPLCVNSQTSLVRSVGASVCHKHIQSDLRSAGQGRSYAASLTTTFSDSTSRQRPSGEDARVSSEVPASSNQGAVSLSPVQWE